MSNAAQKNNKKPRTAITPTRDEDFPEWYQQVIKVADMAENAPVRGCMTIKPYGFAVWENMQRIFDDMIKDLGVQNAYFPLLIPLEFMSREAEHVDGFAKECAVVTHHRLEQDPEGNGLIPSPDAKLEEPYIIRPTSETIIGEAMSRWIQSYRDLPMKLNQWCNVMRWEMRTRMFLRTSEFLWQEGHNAFASAEEADADAQKMLETYVDFAENALAMPCMKGIKTTDETFPGAEKTYTFECMMQDGKALQSGTSHYMGQNFAKSIGIKFQTQDGSENFAYTTSWGISTRLIGGMIMTHGDDDGMIMPPRIAPYPVIILPVIKGKPEDPESVKVIEYAKSIQGKLKAVGVRAHVDERDMRTGDKMWDAIKKGVPLRVEIGGREVEEGVLTHVRRDLGRDSKTTEPVDKFVDNVGTILDDIHNTLFERAKSFRDENTHDVNNLDDVAEFYKSGKIGFVKMDAALLEDPKFEQLKKEHALTPRCLPLGEEGKVIVGKSY